MSERHHIEGRPAEIIAEKLKEACEEALLIELFR